MDQSQFNAVNDPSADSGGHKPRVQARQFLGIHFKCCRTYGRIYRSPDQTEYTGKCPRCNVSVRVPIGSGGSTSRFFSAG